VREGQGHRGSTPLTSTNPRSKNKTRRRSHDGGLFVLILASTLFRLSPRFISRILRRRFKTYNHSRGAARIVVWLKPISIVNLAVPERRPLKEWCALKRKAKLAATRVPSLLESR